MAIVMTKMFPLKFLKMFLEIPCRNRRKEWLHGVQKLYTYVQIDVHTGTASESPRLLFVFL